jgi:hypothetical protein
MAIDFIRVAMSGNKQRRFTDEFPHHRGAVVGIDLEQEPPLVRVLLELLGPGVGVALGVSAVDAVGHELALQLHLALDGIRVTQELVGGRTVAARQVLADLDVALLVRLAETRSLGRALVRRRILVCHQLEVAGIELSVFGEIRGGSLRTRGVPGAW